MQLLTNLRNNCTKIHFFGLGFIQIKLDQRERWHFYTDKLPAFVEEPHNHRYDISSQILSGCLEQTIWGTETPGWVESTHQIVDESCEEGKESKVKEEVHAKPLGTMTLNIGSKYWLSKSTFHTVKPLGDTITKLSLDQKVKRFAQVLRPIGQEKICPFSQNYDESYLWSIVEAMLEEAKLQNLEIMK